MSIFSQIFDSNERQINKLKPMVVKIDAYDFTKLTTEEFKTKTKTWQQELSTLEGDAEKEYLDNIFAEAYALVKEAVKRTLGMEAHDVQLITATVLHQGKIAEQKTGEGKTLTAVFPLYLNSLTKRGCHLITPNDYLSKIGCGWMGPIYEILGVSVGTIVHEQAFTFDSHYTDDGALDSRLKNLRPIKRLQAYQCDITYGTNNEFGFDYLRDNMVWSLEQMVQSNARGEWGTHYFGIVDEVDFILIDEARTPLIISAPDEESTTKYSEISRLITKLQPEADYTTEEKTKNAVLTEEGIGKLEKFLKVENLYEKDFKTLRLIEQSLKANVMYHRDKDYIVKDGEVIIVDEFTGRLMFGRRYSEGLHQAIEAKEGVEIKKESKTLATISFQNYFRMYQKLAGMAGTAETEAEEFHKIYKLEVVVIPTDKTVIRQDSPDLIYKAENSKYQAVIEEIKSRHQTGQPILVGTTSISKNEHLSQVLERRGIKHALLNAKHHEKEALILSEAGEKDAVTVATNMAGRGVDIELGGRKPDWFSVNQKDTEAVKKYQEEIANWQKKHEEVVKLGGLYVIGTERHEARRIDNQLRGRSGRQGDPGESRFFVSLEDDLMRIFGGEQVKKIMEMLKMPDDMPIEHNMVSKSLERSQTRVEGHNFDIRKQLVEYDDVMNKQREIIYQRRRKILETTKDSPQSAVHRQQINEQLTVDGRPSSVEETLKDRILSLIEKEINAIVTLNHLEGQFAYDKIIQEFMQTIPFNETSRQRLQQEISSLESETEIQDKLFSVVRQTYSQREKELGTETVAGIERFVVLSTIDNLWQIHLTEIDHLREGIGLRGYGQRDPLVEYKSEAFKMFEELIASIDTEIVHRIFKVSVARQSITPQKIKELKPEVEDIAKQTGSLEISPARQVDKTRRVTEPVKVGEKIGRNDPCPCGAKRPDGRPKKYKHCHGKNI